MHQRNMYESDVMVECVIVCGTQQSFHQNALCCESLEEDLVLSRLLTMDRSRSLAPSLPAMHRGLAVVIENGARCVVHASEEYQSSDQSYSVY